MAKGKFTDKLKDGVSVKEIEDFTSKYTIEVFSIIAMVIASVSSVLDFFTGPRLSIIFLSLASIIAVLFANGVDNALKKCIQFTFKQEKSAQIVLGVLLFVIAIFIPFLYFGIFGLFVGIAYHYHVHRRDHATLHHRHASNHHTARQAPTHSHHDHHEAHKPKHREEA